MSKNNIQDAFLNQLRKNKIPCTLFLTNGFQYRGTVTGFDTYVVMLNAEGKQQMIFKHVISTIQPAQTVAWENQD
ncbi:RNA chaperone Hfq [Hazenella sp. IB182357]|uniref:RNA-binding protein Hfq n=1 Tax=Polycladospora coralii TaxID=2771432 RepID=A0A926N9I5_9BACL|nr:RNA chaperone Hfq [Polycladospora coralii]MBD1372666.1 RNA chaperone Hfq [Polycladospora coralii]MBS7531060.1 RNA chaperone Hfq [Polycladospora coralii]